MWHCEWEQLQNQQKRKTRQKKKRFLFLYYNINEWNISKLFKWSFDFCVFVNINIVNWKCSIQQNVIIDSNEQSNIVSIELKFMCWHNQLIENISHSHANPSSAISKKCMRKKKRNTFHGRRSIKLRKTAGLPSNRREMTSANVQFE